MSGITGTEYDNTDDATGDGSGLAEVVSSSVSSLPSIILATQGRTTTGQTALQAAMGNPGVTTSSSILLWVILLALVAGLIFYALRK